MQSVRFIAFDYHSDDSFSKATYEMKGSEEGGWKITRNSDPYLELGKGYRLLKTELCGICSTDLDRRFLPFALPQVIGHEVLASDRITGKKYVLEINDTVISRGEEEDAFCRRGIPTHSPTRLVLGIDRLPGGFGPYILAPVGTLVETGELSDKEAVLLEPFAASLHGAEVSLQRRGGELPKKIAVLGPRRLGSLVIAALDLYRKKNGLSYEIVSVVRRRDLADLSLSVGADTSLFFPGLGSEENPSGLLIRSEDSKIEMSWDSYRNHFDLVFDTSGSIAGLEESIHLTEKEIHRKTTNGQPALNVENLTEMVVDEISICGLRKNFPDLTWGILPSSRTWVFVSSSAKLSEEERSWLQSLSDTTFHFFYGTIDEAADFLRSSEFTGELPHFDFAIVSTSEEIDRVLRPNGKDKPSLVRPRGFILVSSIGNRDSNPLIRWLASGGVLSSSRCGDFRKTRSLLESQPGFMHKIADALIRSEFDSNRLPEAYLAAREPQNIKVIVRHSAS